MQRWRRYFECARHGPSSASTLLDRVKQLPLIDLAKVIHGHTLLIVAPHPDDESLGCGGLIAEAAKLGVKTHIAVVTDGAASHPRSSTHPAHRLRSIRRQEATEAAATLGVPAERVSFLEVPDGGAPRYGGEARIIGQRLASLARDIAADMIFTSWNYDPHPDHVAAHQYARMAAKEVGASLFSYPVWAWTLPPSAIMPNLHLKGFSISIEHSIAIKRAAVLKHRSQTTRMIADDPSGFMLTDEHLTTMITSKEFFIAEN